MKTRIQKIICLFLILLGFIPLLLVLSFEIRKQFIRQEMRVKLEHQQLQKITVPANEVIWMDKHEIWINESMFDIESFTIQNGVYTFIGLYDDDETEIVKDQEKNGRQSNEEAQVLAKLFKWLHNTYKESVAEKIIITPAYNTFKNSNSFFIAGCFQVVPTPPPRPFLNIILERTNC